MHVYVLVYVSVQNIEQHKVVFEKNALSISWTEKKSNEDILRPAIKKQEDRVHDQEKTNIIRRPRT